MKLKKLFELQLIVLEQLIYSHHKELDITSDEMMVMFGLLDLLKKRNVFSLSALNKRITIHQDLGILIDSLIHKGYLSTYLEDHPQGKSKELFHLDGLFSKLEIFIEQKDLSNKLKPTNEGLKKVIVITEQKMNRLMTSKELQELRHLMDTHQVTIEELLSTLEQLQEVDSISQIEKMVMIAKKMPNIVIDEKVEKALDDLYKAMK